jgi:hypothetical protein
MAFMKNLRWWWTQQANHVLMFAMFDGVTELQCECCCVYAFAKLQNTIHYYYTLENVGSISKINTGGCKHWPDTRCCSFHNQRPAVWLTTKHMNLVSSLAKDSFKSIYKHTLKIPHNKTAAKTHENDHFPGRWNTATLSVTSIFSNKIYKFLCHIFISSIQKWTNLSTVRVQRIFKWLIDASVSYQK